MEECRDLIEAINESIPDLSSALRKNPSALKQPLATLERLIAALDNNNLDYVLCALEKRQTTSQTFRIVQGDVALQIGASTGYAMEDVTNEYRSGRVSLDNVYERIYGATRGVAHTAVESGEDVVLEAHPRILQEKNVTVPFAFVELVLDEYRSFAGVVVCTTLRTESQLFVVNASEEFSIHVESPIFHCWKCLVNFRGTFSKANAALLHNGTHSIIPCTHSSVFDARAEGPLCDVEGCVVNIRSGVGRRMFKLRPFEFQMNVAPPQLERRELLELRHFIAKSNDRSLDYVMPDRQLCEVGERRCLEGRVSPLVRAYIGDFLRILHRMKSGDDGTSGSACRAMDLDVDV